MNPDFLHVLWGFLVYFSQENAVVGENLQEGGKKGK